MQLLPVPSPRPGAGPFVLQRHRAHDQGEALDGLDPDSIPAPYAAPRVGRPRPPQRPFDEHLADGVERLAHLPRGADHLLPPGHHRTLVGDEGALHRERQEAAEQQPGHHDGGDRDLERVGVGVVEDEARNDLKRGDPRGAEDPVGGDDVGLRDYQRDPQNEEQDADEGHWKLRGAVESEQQRDRAEHPGTIVLPPLNSSIASPTSARSSR